MQIKFPLRWDSIDRLNYIFDANNKAVVQVETDMKNKDEAHPFEKLVGDFKNTQVQDTGYRYFIYQDDIYDQHHGERIGTVVMHSQSVINYILATINSKL